MTRELRQIGAKATADLQYSFPAMPPELHRLRHPGRILAVSVGFGFLKPLQRVRFRLLDVVRAGGIVVPLALDFVLVGIPGLDLERTVTGEGDGRGEP